MLYAYSRHSSAELYQIPMLVQCLTTLATYLGSSAQDVAERTLASQGQGVDSTAQYSDTLQSNAAQSNAPQSDAETWFRELYPRVYAYIRYRIADLHEAQDITSEIMERALTHLESYDARKAAFSTWLFRIAHNTLVNYLKRQKRQSRYQVDLSEGLEDLATGEPSPEHEIVRKEEIARLLACVRTLSPRQQEILSMRFAGRLTNREIARILHMNERTVSVTILRALRTLRRKLQAQLDDVQNAPVHGTSTQQPAAQVSEG